MKSLSDICNEQVNLDFDRRMKSLTKYEREFLHRLLDEIWKNTAVKITKVQAIEVIKSVKKDKITKKNLESKLL